MAVDLVTASYRAAAALSAGLPRPVAAGIASVGARVAARVAADRRLLVQRHLQRATDHTMAGADLDATIEEMFASYARYWVDSFRLPTLSAQAIDEGMDVEGLEHLCDAVDAGLGPIMALPHLGGWEWAGFWLSRVAGFGVTAVVEPLDPPELFEFFAGFREALGMQIVPLGPTAAPAVIRALREARVLCLLCDRDIEGTGTEVEFFGERTTLPSGPATIALRTGAPLLPTACYFKPVSGIHCVVGAPLPVERSGGRLRADVERVTQDLAFALEGLIRAAPEQWHLQQPNWPSDYDALAAMGRPHAPPGAP